MSRERPIERGQALWSRLRGAGPLGFVYAAIGAVLLMAGGALLDARGLSRLRMLQADSARQQAANEALRAENAALAHTIQQLGEPVDRAALERAAREELGFVKQDEIVFKFE